MNITIDLDNQAYNIIIDRGILHRLKDFIPTDGKTLIVTDSGVPIKYSQIVGSNFSKPFYFTFKKGERSKNANTYLKILKFMLDNGFTRKDKVIAVGGGVVGDLSGFVASTYMRGIDFYNIPTTFLSQVDSSIGGKVAIDFGKVKNSVGAFYQPKGVFVDTDVLASLSDRLLYSGLVESIKMASTSDRELFEIIENSTDIRSDAQTIIYRSLLIKKQVVEQDEKESGLRRVLNFGHTIGHAIESYYKGKLYHGECVGLGMLSLSSQEVCYRIEKLLKRYNLPTNVKANSQKLQQLVWHDKKAEGNHVVGVYVNKIGEFKFINLEKQDICNLTEKFI